MRPLMVWAPAVAILVAAVATACGPALVSEGAVAENPACDLAAPSASAAEAKAVRCGADWVNANVRMNQIQAFGTHNSFKLAIPEPMMRLIAERNADAALTLDYSHRSLAEQLDAGARQIELDPYDDPQGGMFLDPLGRRALAAQNIDVPGPDAAVMSQPGIKVLHATDIDYWSNCQTLIDCLTQIRDWSAKNPTHTPILIMINPKHSPISWEGATPVLPFGKEAFERMEAEIASVFTRDQVITPDEVRGDKPTLREGAMAGGWPTLAEARGRVILAIDNGPAQTALYAEGHPSLEGRLAFINTNPEAPEAAYFTMNDPERDLALIQSRVREGFLVRTRADADTREARSGQTTRREAALASGAQYISTDYMQADARFASGYTARLAEGAKARCNPVTAPAGCDMTVE